MVGQLLYAHWLIIPSVSRLAMDLSYYHAKWFPPPGKYLQGRLDIAGKAIISYLLQPLLKRFPLTIFPLFEKIHAFAEECPILCFSVADAFKL
jgi:hypothetical protein